MTTDINELVKLTYETNEKNGYNEYAKERAVSEKAGNKHLGNKGLLVVSEVTEAQDELRKGKQPYEIYIENGKPEGYLVELADAAIRILGDVGEVLAVHADELNGITFADVVKQKLEYNARRKDTATSGAKAF